MGSEEQDLSVPVVTEVAGVEVELPRGFWFDYDTGGVVIRCLFRTDDNARLALVEWRAIPPMSAATLDAFDWSALFVEAFRCAIAGDVRDVADWGKAMIPDGEQMKRMDTMLNAVRAKYGDEINAVRAKYGDEIKRRNRMTPELLDRAAELERTQGILAVEEAFDVSNRTARRYIEKARELGLTN